MRAAYGNARASTLLVVEFYAKWCNSCRRLYPRLCRLAAQESDVLFVKVEFDECKDLCRKLGVVKLPYFHVYNGSGSRLADFASSLDPTKFKRLTDAIEANRGIRCALPANKSETQEQWQDDAYLSSLVKLHHVTFVWRGGGDDVMITGDPAGGWTHTLTMTKVNEVGGDGPLDDQSAATHVATCILPTGTFRFKFIVDGSWIVDPNYPIIADEAENVNNEIFVGAAHWPFQWVQMPTAAPPGPPGVGVNYSPVALDMHAPDRETAAAAGVSGGRVGSGARARGGSRDRRVRDYAESDADEVRERMMEKRRADAERARSLYASSKNRSGIVTSSIDKFRPPSSDEDGDEDGDGDGDDDEGESPELPPPSAVANNTVSTIGADSSFPKKVEVSKGSYTTKSEHETAVEQERAAAFERLKFMRKEREAQASNPSAPGYKLSPSEGAGVVAASPAVATQSDLLTLEERVARVERILNSNNLTEEQWLNEG